MKVYRNGVLVSDDTKSRAKDGRYTSFREKLSNFMFGVGALIVVLVVITVTAQAVMIHFSPKAALAAERVEVDLLPGKLAALQMDLVNRLATQCESKSAKDPDGLIVFDSNHVASLGRLQFQVKTVQHYYKTLYGKTISGSDAIDVATHKESAYQLAHDIIFKTDGGETNWLNCSRKLGLSPEVAVLKKLSNVER